MFGKILKFSLAFGLVLSLFCVGATQVSAEPATVPSETQDGLTAAVQEIWEVLLDAWEEIWQEEESPELETSQQVDDSDAEFGPIADPLG